MITYIKYVIFIVNTYQVLIILSNLTDDLIQLIT